MNTSVIKETIGKAIALTIWTSWSSEKQAISIGDDFPFSVDFGLEDQTEEAAGKDRVSSPSYK